MPTAAEVKEQLTGPGRPVRGRHRAGPRPADAGLQGAHEGAAPDLRDRDRPRRRRRSSSTATARTRSSDFVTTAYTTSTGPAVVRRRPRRPGRGAEPEQPRVVPHVLGHGQHRRHPRRAQRLVDDRRDRLRPAGLRREGPRRRRASGSSASPATSTSAPTSSTSSSSTPTRPTSAGDKRAPPLRRVARRARRRRRPTSPIDEDDYAVIFYTSGTTGRPKGAISTHRSMIANLQNTMYGGVAGADARRRRACRRAPAADGRAVHLAAVPRVGLPLDAGRRAARRA